MENNTSDHIEQRLAELPEDVRQAVLSVEWEQKVHAIAERHKLHIDQSGALGDETLMAMLGITSLNEYPKHLEQTLKIPALDAAAIAEEVSNEVFMPIRASLRAFNEGQAKKSEGASVSPTPTASAATPQPTKPAPAAAQAPTLPPVSTTPPVAPPPSAPIAPQEKQEPHKPQNYAADPYREPPV